MLDCGDNFPCVLCYILVILRFGTMALRPCFSVPPAEDLIVKSVDSMH